MWRCCPAKAARAAGLSWLRAFLPGMRLLAVRHPVPVLRSPALARALHAKTTLDTPIPAELYPGVARLMVWVLSMKAARRSAIRGAA